MKNSYLKISDVDLNNKKVLIRCDFNVPLENDEITSDARLRASLPTIQYALNHGAKIILLSHLGRPEEGKFQAEFSLKPIAERLQTLLSKKVVLIKDWIDGFTIPEDAVVLCENVRFQKGEKVNDPALAKKMAALCDVFVMDAFATAHRAEASTVGVAQYAPIACAGFLLANELDALTKALEHPQKPLIAIIGGSKVSTKLIILTALVDKVQTLIVGGGIANTFLAAQGFPIGKSLYEKDLISETQKIIALADKKNVTILLPEDVSIAEEFSASASATIKKINEVQTNDLILDIGPKTAALYGNTLKSAGTIVWNGPVGVFEFPAFEFGTQKLAEAIAASNAFSIAGGGDTLAAIEKFGVENKISYISTGGGAFLEFIEGKDLPAVKILCERANN